MERGRAGRDLCYTVLTVPPTLREKAADYKTWKRWRSKVWNLLKTRWGADYGYERTDPAGDEDKEVWHPHFNFLWVQRPGFRAFIDVDELRREWAKIIGASGAVDVWHQYAQERDVAKRVHWYDYMGRTWPDWVKAVQHGARTIPLGRPPKVEREKPCCRECGERWRVWKLGSKEEAEFWAEKGPEVCREERLRRRFEGIGPPLV